LGDSLEVQFDVNEDAVEMKSPAFRGRFAGIVAALTKGKVTYQAINTGGLLKIVDGQSEALGATGEFSIEDGKVVSLRAKSGRSSLGDFPTGQPGQPLIYVYVAPPPPKVDQPPKLATVVVKNAVPGEYQVFDTQGVDVTDQSSKGLPAGNYTLKASKPGFQKFEQSVMIDPLKGTSTTVEVAWQQNAPHISPKNPNQEACELLYPGDKERCRPK
jgi:hypothetical protein